MASLFLKSSETNAHPIDIATASDLSRHLGEIDLAAEDIEKVTDSFLYCAIKLERVDTRAANIMKDYLETLGGGIAMSRGAREFTVRDTDVIISGSRRTLLLLAARLKGEPYGLDAVGAEIAACTASGTRVIWGNRTLDFTHKTYVMGILNCTPDSFYPSSRSATLKDAMKNAHEMLEAGVDIIDVGGESTRPGSEPVAEEEEIRRVIPVIQALRGGIRRDDLHGHAQEGSGRAGTGRGRRHHQRHLRACATTRSWPAWSRAARCPSCSCTCAALPRPCRRIPPTRTRSARSSGSCSRPSPRPSAPASPRR